jgi:hypothetical protein
MHFLALLLLLQGQKTPDLSAPRLKSPTVERSSVGAGRGVELTPSIRTTTPGLSSNSDLMTHYEIGVDLGSQREAVGELKYKVQGLENLRSGTDRPDIDSLKTSRLWLSWVFSGVASILAFVWFLRNFLWTATLPYLRKEIVDKASSNDAASVPPD